MYPDNTTLFYLKSVSMQEHFVFLGDVYIQPQLSKMDFLSTRDYDSLLLSSNCKLIYQVARKQFFSSSMLSDPF